MTPEEARATARDLVAASHYGVMTNEQLEDMITAALLLAGRTAAEEMRERAQRVAYDRMASTDGNPPGNLTKLAREIAEDIGALPVSPENR
jgi:ferritin-like protein